MHLSRVNLNLFVVFDAIVSEGSVTAAADKLNLSQPAVSHALARLRELLDDPLFERRGQALLPTATARALMPSVRAALRTLERAVRESSAFDPARSERRFTLGIRNVAEGLVLPQLMSSVAGETAAVDIVAVRTEAAQLEADLVAGRLDAALEVAVSTSAAIRRELFWSDPLVVLARPGHPAIGRGGLELDTYLAQGHVQVSARPRGAGLEDTALRKLGLERRIRLRCKDYTAACRIVAGTDLLATLPARYAEVVNAPAGNRVWPLPFEAPPLHSYLYWHAGADNDASNRWLREALLGLRSAPPGAAAEKSRNGGAKSAARLSRRAN